MATKPTEKRNGRNSRSGLRQYAEAVGAIAGLTAVAYLWPRYRVFSQIYLLGIVALSLRVGRGPVLVAALLSAVAWDYFTIPPRFSFTILNADDIAMFVTFIVVALVLSQLTARIRAQGEHIGAASERESLLTESDRLHRALFDSVSHELKTPLTVLRSAALALQQKAAGEQAALVGEICQATDRLDRLAKPRNPSALTTAGWVARRRSVRLRAGGSDGLRTRVSASAGPSSILIGPAGPRERKTKFLVN
jgi:K+-sensing histidine kinase KdpD